MNFLITGGLGYLGGRLASFLIENSHHVMITTRRSTDLLPDWALKYDIHQITSYTSSELTEILTDINCIFNLAAPDAQLAALEPLNALQAQTEYTWNLLEALKQIKTRPPFINLSTFHVYGASKSKGIISEEQIAVPEHPYAIGHYFSEIITNSYASKNNLNTLNVRLSNAIGWPIAPEAAKWTLVFNDLCRQAVVSDTLILQTHGQQKRNFITIADTVRALCFLAENNDKWPKDRLINCGSKQNLSIEQLARLIKKRAMTILNKELSIAVGDSTDGDYYKFEYNISRLELMGFQWNNDITDEIDKTLTLYAGWF